MSTKRKGAKGGRKRKIEIALPTPNEKVLSPEKMAASISQVHESVDDDLINKLNDDCLRVIFSYLSKGQLIGIERVCKRWQEVALSLWSNKISLTFDDILEITKDIEKFDIKHLDGVLKRCGRYLKKLSLDHFDLSSKLNESIADKIILFICENCTDLNYLKLGDGLITEKGMVLLEKKLACKPNMVTLKIKDSILMNDKFVKKFVENAPKLESLSLPGFNLMTGAGLANSKHALKKINLNLVTGMTLKNIIKILDNFSELEVLKGLSECTFSMLNQRPLKDHLVKYGATSSKFFRDFPGVTLPFSKLRVLKLMRDYSISNKILSEFHKYFPNLESLQLSECYSDLRNKPLFNNNGIKELAKVPKLKSFDFNSLEFLLGDALVYLATHSNGKIEVMECPGCSELRDSEMIKFVSLCPNLKLLNVSFCKNITGQFLGGVLNSMYLRTSTEPLRIKITRSGNCFVSSYQHRDPLLILEEFGELEDDEEEDDDSDDFHHFFGSDSDGYDGFGYF